MDRLKLWHQLQRRDGWAWCPDNVTLKLDTVYAMTSRRYQTVTRRSQLSSPMIDVAMSSEVTVERVLWEIQTVNGWRRWQRRNSLGPPTRERARTNNRGRQLVGSTYNNRPLPVGQSKFYISLGHRRCPEPAACGRSLAGVADKKSSVRAPSLPSTSNYWCGIDFLLSRGWLSVPRQAEETCRRSRAGLARRHRGARWCRGCARYCSPDAPVSQPSRRVPTSPVS